ncbi:MltR family transcriptional regulator [Bradyrhizobium sp. SZCCHNS1054]|uniref:MltR family transcriptional regulator n=1 Tax=Bradyrhizobium sp. SZCCHNS1054 TaxID=3057301 RepID=UPI002915DA7A|nr:MltR family transcriptional regulator [Bradyrhizobium sp. SZCCHNS1054]
MRWSVTHHDEKVAIDELYYHASDRAIAIVVGSMIEMRVSALLKDAMVEERTSLKIRGETIHSRMFHSSGPLGSFSSKIRLAYLLRLLSERAFRDLENLKDIRNLFAHDIEIGSFELQTVSDKCRNFSLVDRYVTDTENGIHGDAEALFGYEVDRAGDRLKHPKERYLLTAQVLSIGIQHGAGPNF